MTHKLDTVGAWLLGLIWILPLAYLVRNLPLESLLNSGVPLAETPCERGGRDVLGWIREDL